MGGDDRAVLGGEDRAGTASLERTNALGLGVACRDVSEETVERGDNDDDADDEDNEAEAVGRDTVGKAPNSKGASE